jgi:hypothetical protein
MKVETKTKVTFERHDVLVIKYIGGCYILSYDDDFCETEASAAEVAHELAYDIHKWSTTVPGTNVKDPQLRRTQWVYGGWFCTEGLGQFLHVPSLDERLVVKVPYIMRMTAEGPAFDAVPREGGEA